MEKKLLECLITVTEFWDYKDSLDYLKNALDIARYKNQFSKLIKIKKIEYTNFSKNRTNF